jgi:hypothetical protein
MESSASRRRGNAVAGGRLCSIASIAAWLLLLYSLGTLVQLMVLGGQPATAAEAFDLLQRNRVIGLLRLDVPTVFALPLYYLLFLGLHATLGRVDPAQATVATVLAFAGVTLVLASPMGLSMLPLSEKYAAASSEEARRLVLAAGEAILATDMWHSTSAYVGGVLLQTGAVLMSVVMVRTAVFSKATGWVGVLSHGLDLIHVALAPFAPRTAAALMMVAGPLYLIWFPRVARELRHVASAEDGPADSLEPRGTRGGGGRHAT